MGKAIWLLLDSRGMGGIETHVLQLATGLQQAGLTVQVVFLNDYGAHPLKTACAQRGVPTRALAGSFAALLQALRDDGPALLHTHGYKAGLFGRLAGRIARIPTYSTYHAGEPGRGRVALYDWLDRHSAWLARGVFAVSQPIAARVATHCTVLDNFVETAQLARSRGRQIAFVGRLSPEKGADRFLQIACHFPEQDFHLYGDGPLAQSLHAAAGANVHFHGQQMMENVWPKIGLLVMPSRHEGLPMAALEAMARGIPLVASRVGALPELILDPRYGWLVEQHNLPGFVAGIAQWRQQDEPQRQTLAAMAAARIEARFSSRAVIPTLLRHYAGLPAQP